MRELIIETARTNNGFRAWLTDDPNTRATSTSGPASAAYNLAVRLFLGHNHLAQLKDEDLDKVGLQPLNGGKYRATYRGQ